MNPQLRRNLFDTFLYNPLTPFFKGESREGSYSFTGSKLANREALPSNQDRILGYSGM